MKFKNVKPDMKVILKDNWEVLSPNSVRLKTITKSDFYTVVLGANEKEDSTGLNVKIKNHLNELAWVSAKALKKYEPKEVKPMLTEEEKNIFIKEFGEIPKPIMLNASFKYSTMPKYSNPNNEDYMIVDIENNLVLLYDTKKKNLFVAKMTVDKLDNLMVFVIIKSVLYNQKDEFDLKFAISLLKARMEGLDKEKKLRAIKFKELYLPLELNHWTPITDDLILYNTRTKRLIQVMIDSYGNFTFVQHAIFPKSNYKHQIDVARLPIMQKFYISENYIYSRCVELNFEHMFAILESCIKIG